MPSLLYALLLWLTLIPPAPAQDHIEVIDLRHRRAEDLIPLLRPLLGPTGAVSGQGGQLLVRATPAQLQQVRGVLTQLDRPPARLLISVRQEGVDTTTGSGIGAGGAVYGVRDGVGGELVIRGRNAAARAHDRADQHVQVIDGGEAYIAAGRQTPLTDYHTTPYGSYTTRTWQPLTTGFYVHPRLNGDQVTVEIAPHRNRAGPGGAVETQYLQTTVSGALGQWLALGGVQTDHRQSDRGLLSSEQRAQQAQQQIWLKVERLP